jgi:hemoglobin
VRMELRENRGWLATPARAGLVLTALVALLLLFPGRGLAQSQTQGEKPKEKTLYERLGGYDAISAVVDDFIGRLGKDPMFERFGQGRGMDSKQRTKQLIKDQLCAYTGGPCVYIGREMATAHQGLQITQKEWDASVEHLKATLAEFKVGDKEQKELLAIVDKLKVDIIEKPKKEAGKDKKEEMAPAKN